MPFNKNFYIGTKKIGSNPELTLFPESSENHEIAGTLIDSKLVGLLKGLSNLLYLSKLKASNAQIFTELSIPSIEPPLTNPQIDCVPKESGPGGPLCPSQASCQGGFTSCMALGPGVPVCYTQEGGGFCPTKTIFCSQQTDGPGCLSQGTCAEQVCNSYQCPQDGCLENACSTDNCTLQMCSTQVCSTDTCSTNECTSHICGLDSCSDGHSCSTVYGVSCMIDTIICSPHGTSNPDGFGLSATQEQDEILRLIESVVQSARDGLGIRWNL